MNGNLYHSIVELEVLISKTQNAADAIAVEPQHSQLTQAVNILSAALQELNKVGKAN